IKKFREGLKAGDSIVTAGGIYGKIRSVNDTTFVVEIAKDVKITIDKGSVYPSAAQADKDAASK
ncbi:MAG: preprotein translocase subunit YajC, partial [Duncaniella sp.]|nr:preprotein translocase subunit YajC [Duncaniella sp.]